MNEPRETLAASELERLWAGGDKLCAERVYWDHASVLLRQAGLWPR